MSQSFRKIHVLAGHHTRGLLLALMAAAPLAAQMPDNWTTAKPLGAEVDAKAWWGAGIWAADKSGPPAPFVDSLGLGNGIVGGGIHLEGGFRAGHWDVAAELIGYREPGDTPGGGEQRLAIYRSHILHRSRLGWVAGLEQEPLNWGYGLNGGYVLGEASRPFPRFRFETPRRELSILGTSLGAWKGQFFLGRLLGDRPLGEEVQDPAYRTRRIAVVGDPERPFISGFRLDALFGPDIELYMNYINLFGGYLNGRSMFEGYGFKDYATSFLGFKDALAEASSDFNDPNRPPTPYKNKARSASNSDVGFRVRLEPLQKLFRAEDVRVYVSRGSKAVNIQFGLAAHQPLHYWWEDTRKDLQKFSEGAIASTWDQRTRYTAPSPDVPNDTVGLLMSWSKVRLGIEYLDTVNSYSQDGRTLESGHRSFEQATYLRGFYYGGDPLGEALGGEARAWTLNLQWGFGPRLSAKSWITWGARPFRDVPELWILDHPGAESATNTFAGLQQTVDWRFSANGTFRVGASAQRQSAVANVKGASDTGFRWFADLGFTWPAPRAPRL
ncbi:MAG TPA: capsule assembly Wzi family protein [Holophagaceae bacterium]|nr:capsule assembly Wzi family protein [Holophagaceae bacterium]